MDNSSGYAKYGAGFAAIAIAVKIAIYIAGFQYEQNFDRWAMFGNVLWVLLAVMFTCYRVFMVNRDTRLDYQLKETMKAVAVFAILFSAFLYIHYSFIDTEFMQSKIDTGIVAAQNISEETLKLNPKGYTKEEFVQKEREMLEFIFAPFTQSSFSLFGLLILGFVYSLLVTFIFRKFVKL